MQKTLTWVLGAVGCLLGLARPALAQTSYVRAPLTPASFNQDIIVEGTGAANTRATSDMDNGIAPVQYCYVAAGYVNPTGTSPTTGLPAGGVFTSVVAATPGLSFQTQPYGPPAGGTTTTSNNALRLTNATTTGTLTLATPTGAGYVYLLNASGNGNSAYTAVVNFTDGTTQSFSDTSYDWFYTLLPTAQRALAMPVVNAGFSRVNFNSSAIESNTNDPRLYQNTLALATANYGKTIQSITVTRTATTGAAGSLNVLAVSLGLVCALPSALSVAASANNVCPGTGVNLSAIATANGYGGSYQWQQSTNGGATFTNIAGATAATYTAMPTVTTQYQLVLTCGSSTITSNAVTVTVLPTTSTLAYGAAGTAIAFCTTSGPQAVVTATPAGGTFTSTPGLSLDPTTGTITPGTSTAGIYTVTYTPPASTCANSALVTVVIDAPPAVAVSYGTAGFCQAVGTTQPTTVTPVGGTFTGSAGLVIDQLTGTVNLTQTPAGTYTVSYTSFGTCAATATATLTVLPVQTATLTFNGTTFCKNGAAPVPTATPAGGTFTGSQGLALNGSTGAIDLAATAAGTYTVTYLGPGPCAAPATASVTILPVPVVSVSYRATPYCKAEANPAPASFAPAGGTFTGSQGLVVNTATGVVNLAATPAGTYTVRYTNAGPCTSTATATVTIVPVQTVTLSYGATSFCKAGAAPVAAASPAGGTFVGTGPLALNPATGAIDLAATPTGTYTVTYTSTGFCASQATATFTIQGNNAPTYPTVVTPNGDGKNDVLKFQLADVQNYSLQVFSRWGRQVYEGHNAAEGWNPADSTPGTYYYLVEYTDCTGRPLLARNWVEVVK